MWALKCYKCECCGSDFVSCKALKYHFRQKHFGKAPCEKCGQEVLRENLQDHSKSVYDRSAMERHKLNWENLEERNIKHMATEISKTCRMCSRHFGTVFSRKNHEIQEHHFTANKRDTEGFIPPWSIQCRNDGSFFAVEAAPDMPPQIMPLWCTDYLENMLECKSPQELQRFAEENIHPAPGALSAACVAEVGALLQLLRACFPVPASRVIQGGSYVKGTDTQGHSEIDVVLLSDVFANVNHCKKQLREGLDTLRENLKQTSRGNRILMGKRASLSLRFNFLCTEGLHSHSFEIMACCDVLGPAPSTDLRLHLYRQLYLCHDSEMAQLWALALLPYQVDFVKASVMRVKELIRLMVHWFRTSFANSTEENKFRRLPSSYTVELLTIHIWELAGKPLLFSLVQGMRAVLKLLVRYAEIDVVWHRHYHPKFPIFVKVNQKHTRPFILDPANPTVNVCDTCNAWDEVALVARHSLLKPLFSRVRAEPPWLFTNNW